MPKKVQYMTIRTTKEVRDKLAEIAEREHRSLSGQALALIIKAIEEIENAKRD